MFASSSRENEKRNEDGENLAENECRTRAPLIIINKYRYMENVYYSVCAHVVKYTQKW